MRETFALAIDLGGTNIKTVAYSSRRGVLLRRKVATRAEQGGRAVLARMAAEAAAARALSGLPARAFSALGVGSPGPLDCRRGRVLEAPNLPGLKGLPLAASLGRALGLPVTLDNDARCAAWGEFRLGAGRDCRDMALLTLGTGVGGGIILDGRLRRGPDDSAGELGFLYVDPRGPRANFGLPGSVEAFASATGLARLTRAALGRRRRGALWRLCGGRPASITAAMAHRALLQGDPAARRAWDQAGAALGLAVAGLLNALNLERVVLGGGVMAGGGRELLARVRAVLRRAVYPQPLRRARILAAELGDDAGAVGAAELALDAAAGRRR